MSHVMKLLFSLDAPKRRGWSFTQNSTHASWYFISISVTQFPVRLSFLISINKSQGQIFAVAGLHCEESRFVHGQFYMGCFRVGSKKNLYLCLDKKPLTKKIHVHIKFSQVKKCSIRIVFFINYSCKCQNSVNYTTDCNKCYQNSFLFLTLKITSLGVKSCLIVQNIPQLTII